MKKLMFLVLTVTVMLSAAFVPVDRARKVAENQYMQYCADASVKSANIVKVVENKFEGQATWYAFEFDRGFVIVSADDAVKPILGYSDHGFVSDLSREGGQNFKEWFGNYDKQIAYARRTGYVDTKAQETWKNIENNIFPSSKASVIVDRLVKSAWDQVWPWNDDCPYTVVSGDSTFTYVGCVATAMAQITRYHRWPDVGVGSASYSWNNKTTNITLSANFASHTWNYDLMPEVNAYEYGLYPTYWESGITQAEVDELALQSYWMGLSVNMDYGDDADGGSGAYSTDVDNAFLDHWKASSSSGSSFTTPAVGAVDPSYSTIKAQLDAGRPWYWSGGVHAFVLDGYRDDYWYHFNWGWAGSYDGWFERGFLVPDGQGSGGGDGDYTAGQYAVTYVPSTNPFTAWAATTVSGNISNYEDITVNWTAKSGATEYELYRTVNKEGIPTLLTTTTELTYDDLTLPAGLYSYHVVVVYPTGKSHNSNVYSANVVIESDYKYPTAVSGTRVGRTAIDLSWVKPYTGVALMTEGWESGTNSTWQVRGSYAFESGSNNKNWLADDGTRWGPLRYDDIEGGEAYVHDGDYSNYIGYNAGGLQTPLSWLISPEITVGSGYTWDFWVWYCNNAPAGSGLWPTDIYYVWYTGDFSERTGVQIAANTDIIEFWDGEVLVANDPVNWGNNKYESMVSFDLTAYAGTGRLAFVYSYNDGYQSAVDDIVVGAPTGGSTEPTGYEVYRNGSLATTISGPTNITWSDTGFADGNNTYFVRATYPAGTSIPSLSKTVYMDANPKPGYLTGVGGSSAQLDWYQPYKNPPMWYCYYDVNTSTTTIDMMDVPAPNRRVEFATSAGYYYPVTIDSVGAYFYDWDEGNWGGENTYIIRIVALGFYAPGGGFLPDTTLWESGTLTATHMQMDKIGLGTPLVRTKGWAVEVEALAATTGNPGNLAGPSPDGNIHSFFYYSVEDSYDYYMITGNGDPAEYAILSYITSSDPPAIAKTGWVTPSDLERSTSTPGYALDNPERERYPMADTRNKTISGSPVVYAPKAMDYYKIYRDGGEIGTSTTLNYEDTSASAGDHTYKVTAFYSSPAGESDFSNEIVLNITGSSLQIPTNVVTSQVGSDIKIDWDDMSAPEYVVYYSADPYGLYTQLTTVATNTYTYSGGDSKMFFQIVSSDGAKELPQTIEVKRSVK